jgi:hypothetical protein
MLIAMTAAVFMAMAGPFGTWREPLVERLGFWVLGVGACGWVACSLELRLKVIPWLRPRRAVRAFGMALLLSPIGALLASGAAALAQGRGIDWPLYWTTVPEVSMVAVGFSALILLSGRRALERQSLTMERRADQASQDPTLHGLVPSKLRGARVLAVQAQDHYVTLYTDRGTALVSMSFEEALARLSALDGARVHRSWWVARSAVVGVARGDGRATLELLEGTCAPVSRRYAKVLRQMEWY